MNPYRARGEGRGVQGGPCANGSEPDMQGPRGVAQVWAGQERTVSLNVTPPLADGDLQVARPGAEPPENTDAAAAAEEGECAWGGRGSSLPLGAHVKGAGPSASLVAHAHHHST